MARGELREETGLTAERMTLLATLQIGYGVMNQKHHVFLAEGLIARRTTTATPKRATWKCIASALRNSKRCCSTARIVDNCSAAAWGIYRLWRERQLSS